MPYDPDRAAEFYREAIEEHTDADPAFAVVSGSHVYGFADEGSDVDVRGLHLADGRRYMLLNGPAERLRINQDGLTQGFEDYPEMDLVSRELRKFVHVLFRANFTVVEVVCGGHEVVNEVPDEIGVLCGIVDDELPLDVPQSYYGLAKSTYEQHLVEGREGYDPTAKNYLYALRGLLGAAYVAEREAIEVHLPTVSEAVLGDSRVVDGLVAVKRDETAMGDALSARADALCSDLFDDLDLPDASKGRYRERLDDWQRSVREARGEW